MNKKLMLDAIRAASEEVFSTMLGMQAACGVAYEEPQQCDDSEEVLALIGIAGSWMGTGSISCSPDFACKISSTMLMSEYQHIDADVLDALAEIANMIFGNVKTFLEEQVGPLGLSIPTVIYGKNFTTKRAASQLWSGLPLRVGDHEMQISLGLTPNTGLGATVRHYGDHRTGLLLQR